MADNESVDYDALEARYVDPATPASAIPGTVLTGDAAAAVGRELLVQEYGTLEAVETAIRRGRRRVGDDRKGASPTVRARIADREYEALTQLHNETGRDYSDLVREGVHLLLEQHKLVS